MTVEVTMTLHLVIASRFVNGRGCIDIALSQCLWVSESSQVAMTLHLFIVNWYGKKQRLQWHCTKPLPLALQTGGGCNDIALSHCLWVCSWTHKLRPWHVASRGYRIRNQRNNSMALSSSLHFCPFLFLLASLFLFFSSFSPTNPLTSLLLFSYQLVSHQPPPFLLSASLLPTSSFSPTS